MTPNRFEQLVDSYLIDSMSPADEAELHQQLQGDAGLRKQFAAALLLDVQLRKALAAPAAPCLPLPTPRKSPQVRFAWAAAAALLFSAGVAAWGVFGRGTAATEEQLAKEEVLERINQERAKRTYIANGRKHKVPLLHEDEALRLVAKEHARELSRKVVKSIMDEDVKRELEEAGYTAQSWVLVPGWDRRLSNVVDSWLDARKQTMQGKNHQRGHLLNPTMEDVGIAVYRDGHTGTQYVFVLLAKKKHPPVGGAVQPDDGPAISRVGKLDGGWLEGRPWLQTHVIPTIQGDSL